LTDDEGALLPVAATLASQFVPPSGRLEVLLTAPPPGVKAYLVTHAVDTGCAGDRLPERRLAVITSAGSEAESPAAAHVTQEPRRNLLQRIDRPPD